MMPQAEAKRILGMLAYRRPAGSATERKFIKRYIDSIPGVYADGYGNRLLVCPGSKVMISCHTDTVSRVSGRQRVSLSRSGIVSVGDARSNCLGADDTAGVYAALRMIEAGVKATFVFHREEEIGGRGSDWLADNYPDWLRTFDVCLALDRRGTKDIIVTQQWETCASDTFALGLAKALDMGHLPADGIFTDSANYTRLIPECSNISIGYRNEHTRGETLDLNYLEAVIRRLVTVDWESLPVRRDPMERSSRTWGWSDYIDTTSTRQATMIEDGDVLELQEPEDCAYCGVPTDVIMDLEDMWVCQSCYNDEMVYKLLADEKDSQ